MTTREEMLRCIRTPAVRADCERLLAKIPATQQRLQLAGVSMAVLEAGDGAPVVLLRDPGGNSLPLELRSRP